ncbi:AtzE family amidohydrolase [Rhodoferax lacus]|uniref:AtzE family amidohydrolase n=1 Tax=Rhodoferax lacus TaxID=2184758 RepID=A0A3E1RDZ4_9BURK|nr:AtzE family amidohydrolase [Rhodoferax lacus]RFO97589.1 AtzE family amidohydrolase [Rhodoferax lacus]
MSAATPTTVQLARAIASGERSAREVLEATLQTIEATNPQVNAFIDHTHARARREADAVDALRQSGAVLPSLAGVPYAVKNLFDVEGLVTLAGSKVNQGMPPAQADAALITQMQKAGAVLVGTLNMDEYAYGFTTENSHYGPSHNPHKLACTAGGSSGGSGAAVAAGQVPIALASDTNGSIRVPASFCGVWGLKPTFGRLSRRGSYPFVHSIDHLGPLADSVEGLALAYDALQMPDSQDPGCHALRVQPVGQMLGRGSQGLRIARLGGYFEELATPSATEAATTAARTLNTPEIALWPDAALARAAAFIITASEGGRLHLADLKTRLDDFEPLSVDRFLAGALQPTAWYLRAQQFRRIYRERVLALFKDWDVLVAPATPLSAPLLGAEWLDINGQQMPCRPSIGLLSQPISFSGCPVVTAPLWPSGTGGMPIGVQLIAAPWREDLALRAAQSLQDAGIAHLKTVKL